jgi:hypothetical protein
MPVKGTTSTRLVLCWLSVTSLRTLKSVVLMVTALRAAKMDRYDKVWLFITSATYVWPVSCWENSDFSSRLLSYKSEIFLVAKGVTLEDGDINKYFYRTYCIQFKNVPSDIVRHTNYVWYKMRL